MVWNIGTYITAAVVDLMRDCGLLSCARAAMARRNMGSSGMASESTQRGYTSSTMHSANGYQPSTAFPASTQSRSAPFPPVNTAAMALYATERQSFQLDAVQRRHLEQKLMNLQLEKDQVL